MHDPRIPVPGVTALEHTADVGLEVRAPDLPTLLERTALGMDWLLREAPPPRTGDEVREVELDAGDPPMLLRGLLRELLHWHERDGFAPRSLEVGGGEPGGPVRVQVTGGIAEARPVREIKGITLHALAAERRDGAWWGRVIFDV